jgi:hypothetical protein
MAGQGGPKGSGQQVMVMLDQQTAKNLLLALSGALNMVCQPKEGKKGGAKGGAKKK